MRIVIPIILALSVILSSCGKSSEGEVLDALEESYLAMSDGDCEKAFSALNSIPYDKSNPAFLKAYSSSYACRAGYSTINLFAYDLDKFKTAGNIFNQLARFSLSNKMTSPTDEDYVNMTKALDVLYDADRSKFTQDEKEDIESQIAFLQIVQLGMYVNYYGNVDADGNKGQGDAANQCFLKYTTNEAQTLINDNPLLFGSCGNNVGSDAGHQDLNKDNKLNIENVCHGIVAVNNALDIFPRVIANADTNLLDKSWVEDILKYKDLLATTYPDLEVLSLNNFDNCVETLNKSTNQQIEVEAFFLLFESMLL